MGFHVQKENEGRIATIRINQLQTNTSAANVSKNKHSAKGFPQRGQSRMKPRGNGGYNKPPANFDSEGSVDSSGDSDDDDAAMGDPTIQALSNPNKTVSRPEALSAKKSSWGGGDDSDSQSESSNDDDNQLSDLSDGPESAGNDSSDEGTVENNPSNNHHPRSSRKKYNREASGQTRSTFANQSDSDSNDDSHSPSSTKENDKLKAELLSKFDRLQKKGVKVSRKFTMKSKLKDMQKEFERLNRNIEVDSAIKFQRKALVAILSGVEFLNKKFDPFAVKLEGWTESVTNDITEYDNVFERLYDKYHGTAEMAPEIEVMMMIAGSGLMFHMSKSLFNNSNFNINDVLKNNPELMKNLMSQMLTTRSKDKSMNCR